MVTGCLRTTKDAIVEVLSSSCGPRKRAENKPIGRPVVVAKRLYVREGALGGGVLGWAGQCGEHVCFGERT